MTPGRARLVLAVPVAAALLLLAGCGPAAATGAPNATPPGAGAAPTTSQTTSPAPAPPPAASAGGACHLLDYQEIRSHLGLDFDVAVAHRSDDTHVCVVRAVAAPDPYLVLTVTPTVIEADSFADELAPEEVSEVSELGKAAFHGPGLEVSWLSGDDRLITLALATPDGAPSVDFEAGLLDLARAVDRART